MGISYMILDVLLSSRGFDRTAPAKSPQESLYSSHHPDQLPPKQRREAEEDFPVYNHNESIHHLVQHLMHSLHCSLALSRSRRGRRRRLKQRMSWIRYESSNCWFSSWPTCAAPPNLRVNFTPWDFPTQTVATAVTVKQDTNGIPPVDRTAYGSSQCWADI